MSHCNRSSETCDLQHVTNIWFGNIHSCRSLIWILETAPLYNIDSWCEFQVFLNKFLFISPGWKGNLLRDAARVQCGHRCGHWLACGRTEGSQVVFWGFFFFFVVFTLNHPVNIIRSSKNLFHSRIFPQVWLLWKRGASGRSLGVLQSFWMFNRRSDLCFRIGRGNGLH